MPYSAVPNSGQTLGQTRDQIRNNIQQLKDSLAENHFDLDTPNQGKHKYVELIQTTIPTTLINEGTVYTKTASAVTELFYTPDASAKEYQLTRTITADYATFATSTGWTFLPGGLLLQYGRILSTGASTNITFPITFNNNPAYSVTVTFNQNDATYGVGNVTNAGFTFIKQSTTNASINWMAIGK